MSRPQRPHASAQGVKRNNFMNMFASLLVLIFILNTFTVSPLSSGSPLFPLVLLLALLEVVVARSHSFLQQLDGEGEVHLTAVDLESHIHGLLLFDAVFIDGSL